MIPDLTRTFLAAPPLPPGRPNLVLAGAMGAGKTEVGRRAASRLGLPFVDGDELAVRRTGMSVPQIFERDGEAGFRRLESEILADLGRLSGTVIATGGGAVLHGEAFAALTRGAEAVVLTASPEVLGQRIRLEGGRPLAGSDPAGSIGRLLAQRAGEYAAAGTPLDTTALSPEQVTTEVASRYRRRAPATGPVHIDVATADGSYPVLVGPGAVEAMGPELARLRPTSGRVVVVVDEEVDRFAGDRISAILTAAGFAVGERCLLPAGEAAKAISCVEMLWSRFRAERLDRTGAVVAVGGGAAMDAAGFAAATYARGVPLVNVATTLLGCVDASLGGKVAVDHAGVKNLVGAFHDPTLVVADTALLEFLPRRVLRAGLAESVKAAVLASPAMLDLLAVMAADGATPVPMDWVVEQSVRIKAAYVAADPRDHSLRQALNLGHTFAHAIEAATDYGVSHGEAVSVGLVAAARLGAEIGSTELGLAGSLGSLLGRLGLPVRPPDALPAERLLAAIEGDKKRRSGRPVAIVPARGGAELVAGLTGEDLVRTLTSR